MIILFISVTYFMGFTTLCSLEQMNRGHYPLCEMVSAAMTQRENRSKIIMEKRGQDAIISLRNHCVISQLPISKKNEIAPQGLWLSCVDHASENVLKPFPKAFSCYMKNEKIKKEHKQPNCDK